MEIKNQHCYSYFRVMLSLVFSSISNHHEKDKSEKNIQNNTFILHNI